MTSTSWIKAQQHYYTHGKKEGRVYQCDASPYMCANEGQECKCQNGFLYFGLKYNAWQKTTPNTNSFQQMQQWPHIKREAPLRGGQLACDWRIIGDPAPGQPKQCWCEPWEQLPPFHIAVEGQEKVESECPTGKYIYYGQYKDGTTVLDFKGMVAAGKYARVNNQSAETRCN